MKKCTTVQCLLFLSILLVPVGCKSKSASEETGDTKYTVDQLTSRFPLLQTLPDSAQAFVHWDVDSKEYQTFRQSAWGQSTTTLFDSLSKSINFGGVQEVVDSAFIDTPVFAAIDKNVSDILAYVASPAAAPSPHLVVAVEARGASELKAIQDELVNTLKGRGFEILNNEDYVTVQDDAGQAKLFYRTNSSRLTIASDLQVLKGLESQTQKRAGQSVILNNFQSAAEKLPERNAEFMFGYLHAQELLKAAHAKGNVKELPQSIPVEELVFNRTFTNGPSDNVAVTLQEDALKSLPNLRKGNLTAFDSLPAELAIGFGLNGYSLQDSLVQALKTAEKQKQIVLPFNVNLLETIQSMAVGLGDVAPGTMFPGLTFSFKVSPESELPKVLKAELAKALKNNAGFEMQWQEKKIADQQVQYIATPLGIGMYLATDSEKVLLATSETALQGMLTIPDNTKSFSAILEKNFPDTKGVTKLGSLRLSFPTLAQIIRNLSGSLAMFTGGQALVEESELQGWEKLGSLGINATLNQNTILVRSSYRQ